MNTASTTSSRPILRARERERTGGVGFDMTGLPAPAVAIFQQHSSRFYDFYVWRTGAEANRCDVAARVATPRSNVPESRSGGRIPAGGPQTNDTGTAMADNDLRGRKLGEYVLREQ